MLSWLGKRFVVLALVLVTGGHWALLQSVAWVGMAVSYSQDCTLRQALVKTFDGQHPCKLCKAVREGKSAEKDKNGPRPLTKFDLFPGCRQPMVASSLPAPFLTTDQPLRAARSDPPPTPPPRSILG
jgi:hypothetical protein